MSPEPSTASTSVETALQSDLAVSRPTSSAKGTLFNIMRYATHDGPGIRTTVFFKGCPLRCLWCHNPEGQSPELELFFRADRCMHCGDCSKACPNGAILFNEATPLTLKDKCRLCGTCVDVCQSMAREMTGRSMTVGEVIEEIQKDVIFYDESGGGVTFSGGEPLMQPGFLQDLLEACKERRIHTAVETCGLAESQTLLKIAAHVDLFLYDLKIIDSRKHEEFTGVPNSVILANLKALSDHHPHIVIRFPLIPGTNDDEENMLETGRFLASLRNVREIEILPYHRTGTEKYRGLGRTYDLKQIKPPSSEQIHRSADIFRGLGLQAKVGG